MACLPPCDKCIKDHISCGLDQIYVLGVLNSNLPIKWVITNKDAEYFGGTTTDANGQFIIDTSLLPPGLLNPYAGTFTLTVFSNDAYQCTQYTWNNSAYCDPYTCIDFDVKNGTEVKNNLGCECGEALPA